MMQKRNQTLDIVKGICIILMVVGHSGCPKNYLYDFINMFLMPCFFFVSGWLLSHHYLTDVRTGLRNKLEGSYCPFVIWQLIFLTLHNVFAQMNFYADTYSLKEFVVRVLRIITMTGGESLLGGFWFLISLTWASIVTLLLLSVLKRWGRLSIFNISAGVILILVIASLYSFIPIKLPYQFGDQTIMATAFYISGFLFRKLDFQPKRVGMWGAILYVVPVVTALFTKFDMEISKGLSVYPFYVVAMFGIIATFFCSSVLTKTRIASTLSYIGNKTLYILIFHLLAFKLVSYLLIKINGYPINYLLQFPVLKQVGSGVWIVYSISGVCLSLLVWKLFHLPCYQKILIRHN